MYRAVVKCLLHGRGVACSNIGEDLINLLWTKTPNSVTFGHWIMLSNDPFGGIASLTLKKLILHSPLSISIFKKIPHTVIKLSPSHYGNDGNANYTTTILSIFVLFLLKKVVRPPLLSPLAIKLNRDLKDRLRYLNRTVQGTWSW